MQNEKNSRRREYAIVQTKNDVMIDLSSNEQVFIEEENALTCSSNVEKRRKTTTDLVFNEKDATDEERGQQKAATKLEKDLQCTTVNNSAVIAKLLVSLQPLDIVEHNGLTLKYIPQHRIDREVANKAVQQNMLAIKYVPKPLF